MSKEIIYSDGDIENEILYALREADDVSSDASIAISRQRQSWAFEYHLSRDRANIVRHLDLAGKRVLEIGAGMGAVSRYVAERCSFLQIVEGTSRRLDCLKERLRDLANFDVYCGNFSEFQSENKFDVVLIVGVLEYAEIYYEVQSDQNPYVEFLKKAKSLLSEGGSLVLAIENRLGMKYWAGATEDHTGGYFDGILGYRTTKSVRTFSKRELLKVFKEAGFDAISVQYPFPDYKIPKSILTEDLERERPDIFSSIASGSIGRDYSQARSVIFSDSVAFDGMTESGLLGEFANSFLLISKVNSGNRSLYSEELLALTYSSGRVRNAVTRFSKTDRGVEVSKKLITSDDEIVDFGDITWTRPNPCVASEGTLLLNLYRRLLTFREWETFEFEWFKFIFFVESSFGSLGDKLSGAAWDLIPQNVILGRFDKYIYIDQEWVHKDYFSKSWFLLRCILSFDQNMHVILSEKFGSLHGFYEYSCKRIGISCEMLFHDCELEVEVQRCINGSDPSDYKEWKESLFCYLKSPQQSYGFDLRTKIKSVHSQEMERERFQSLEREYGELRGKYSDLENELKIVRKSNSFKVFNFCSRALGVVKNVLVKRNFLR